MAHVRVVSVLLLAAFAGCTSPQGREKLRYVPPAQGNYEDTSDDDTKSGVIYPVVMLKDTPSGHHETTDVMVTIVPIATDDGGYVDDDKRYLVYNEKVTFPIGNLKSLKITGKAFDLKPITAGTTYMIKYDVYVYENGKLEYVAHLTHKHA
jgi:hypothetical protein